MARYPRKPGDPIPLVDADTPRFEGRMEQGELAIFAFKPTVTTIGRHPNCDVRLRDREVSKQHATVEQKGGHAYLTDLDSSNGTYVNGRLIGGVRLRDGDDVVIGSHHLVVRLGRLNTSSRPEDAMEAGALEDQVFIYPFARLNELLTSGERKSNGPDAVTDRALEKQLTAGVGVGELATLHNNLEKLRIASDFHQGLGLEPDGSAVPAMLVRVTRQLTDADHVVLLTVDGRDRLVRRASSRRDEEQDELPISDQVLKRVRDEKATVLSGNLRTDARFTQQEAVVALGMRSVLAVPLLIHGEVRGILHCDTRQRPNAFTDTDARILSGLASHAAMAMDAAS
jgi:adenylate cyclase